MGNTEYNRTWRAKYPHRQAAIIHKHKTGQSLLISPATRPKPAYCEVCGRADNKICFDHDHRTGEFRGWLCNSCNLSLGHMGDNPELLERLATYLRKRS